MPFETSRRRFLGGVAAVVGVGLGAGCLGSTAPELRVRNFSGTSTAIRVEIATATGETILESEYELAPDEQATEDDVYDSAGTYAVTVTGDVETTDSEITVDEPDDVITHVTVRDDSVEIGRIAP